LTKPFSAILIIKQLDFKHSRRLLFGESFVKDIGRAILKALPSMHLKIEKVGDNLLYRLYRPTIDYHE